MNIISSKIIEDRRQIDGRRHVLEEHIDISGGTHYFWWIAELDQNIEMVLEPRAIMLSEYLEQREIAQNVEEILNGGI